MRIWIDVEDASGSKLGDGPIQTALNWDRVARLDRTGEFTTAVPVGERLLNLATVRRVLHGWAADADGGKRYDLGAGRILNITTNINAGPTVVELSGRDLMDELADRSVGDLELFDWAIVNPDRAIQHDQDVPSNVDLDEALDGNPATTVELTLSHHQYLYVGHELPFRQVSFAITVPNAGHALLHGQIFLEGEWREIELEDGTAVGTGATERTMAQSGTVSWDDEQDWVKLTHDDDHRYWMRFFVRTHDNQAASITCTVAEITILSKGPQANDLPAILALAPPGWSLDTNWYTSTAAGTYIQFSGESVLAALVKVAEMSGEHFRLGTGRKIQWLRDEQPVAPIWLVQAGGDMRGVNPDVAYILDLKREILAADIVNYLTAYGSGNGEARLTMEHATESPPAGMTLSADKRTLIHTASVSAYGRVDRNLEFNEVSALADDTHGRAEASNQLLRAAAAYLTENAQPRISYRLRVVGVRQEIRPGDVVRVFYREERDGRRVIDIDDELHVLETVGTVDNNGVRITEVLVGNVRRWPLTSAEKLARRLEQAERYKAQPQPVEPSVIIPPVAKPLRPTVSGSTDGVTALQSLITALDLAGTINNQT